jgi:hypothetical protein
MRRKKSLKIIEATGSNNDTQKADDSSILNEMFQRFGRAFNLRRYDPSF